MKKYFLFSFIMIIGIVGKAQENKPANTVGIGLGLGILTSETSILNASMNVEGDVFLSKNFSIM